MNSETSHVLARKDAVVEVVDVQNGQADLLVPVIDDRSERIIVERIVLAGFVHGSRLDVGGGHDLLPFSYYPALQLAEIFL